MYKNFNIQVDIKNSNGAKYTEIVQGDTGTVLNISILDSYVPIDLTGLTLKAIINKADGTTVFQDDSSGLLITDAPKGLVELKLKANSVSAVGNTRTEIVLFSGEDRITSEVFNFYVRASLDTGNVPVSTNEVVTVTQYLANTDVKIDTKLTQIDTTLTNNINAHLAQIDTTVNNAELERKTEFDTIKNDYSTYKNVMIAESNVAALQSQINNNSSALADIVSCKKYGFIADYQGTPQYDGQDGTRITCTDNTQAFSDMLDDAIAKKNLRVYFPAGHYGIKFGNVIKDLTGCNLTIIGDGIDNTIIDYIKEDNTKTAYVDEITTNFIARINNANNVVIKDLTLKATTNYNNVNGNQSDNNAVYCGAVWGLIFDKFNYLRLDNIKVARFNYRGITTMRTGNTSWETCNPQVDIINCIGTINKGSGFWIKDTKICYIQGGEYSYNGQKGTMGTGYGVTCSSYVYKAIVKGGWYHNNYRKGFDTHGCLNVDIDGSLFENNVLFHFMVAGWSIYANTDYSVSITNVTMKQGQDTDSLTWLQSCYGALQANGLISRGMAFTISDSDGVGNYKNVIKNVTLNNVSILGAYNGFEYSLNGTGKAFDIIAQNGNVKINKCNFDLSGFGVNSNSVYSATPIALRGLTVETNDTKIKWLENSVYNTNQTGALFDLKLADTKVSFKDCDIVLNNCYLIATTSGGAMVVAWLTANSKREFINLMLNWTNLPANTDSNYYFGDLFNYDKYLYNVKVRVGDVLYKVPDINNKMFYFFQDEKVVTAQFPTTAINTNIFEIILDQKVYNFVLEVDTLKDYFKSNDAGTVTDGTTFTIISRGTFTDTDGRDKTRITFKTKTAINADASWYIRVRIVGYKYSWGIESINKLV